MRVIADIRPRELTGYRAVAATVIGAGLMVACAKLAFFLPGNPLVPVTMQVFGVVLCGMVLGSRLGAISQINYITAGLLGAPVFVGLKAGPVALLGPTGGYLIGFVVASYLTGVLVEKADARKAGSFCAAGLVGAAVVHACGVAWLSVWGAAVWHGFGVWAVGSAPFIALDAVKVMAAAVIASTGKR